MKKLTNNEKKKIVKERYLSGDKIVRERRVINYNTSANLSNINNIDKNLYCSYDNFKDLNQTEIISSKNTEYLDNENMQLKSILEQLSENLEIKDKTLYESQIMLKKLNEEYTLMLNNYKQISKENELSLQKENSLKNTYNKIKLENENIQKKFISLQKNFTKLKSEQAFYKKNSMILKNSLKNKEQENAEKNNEIFKLNQIIENLKKQLEEKDKEIKEQKETIYIFKSNMNLFGSNKITDKLQLEAKEFNRYSYNLIEIKPSNEYKNKASLVEQYNFMLKNNKCNLLLEESLYNEIFIPNIGINFINKEYLVSQHFGTELIKLELMSSYIREEKIMDLLNTVCYGIINIKHENELDLSGLVEKMEVFKKISDLYKSKYLYYKYENNKLKSQISNLYFNIENFQQTHKQQMQNFKDKLTILLNENEILHFKIKNTEEEENVNIYSKTERKKVMQKDNNKKANDLIINKLSYLSQKISEIKDSYNAMKFKLFFKKEKNGNNLISSNQLENLMNEIGNLFNLISNSISSIKNEISAALNNVNIDFNKNYKPYNFSKESLCTQLDQIINKVFPSAELLKLNGTYNNDLSIDKIIDIFNKKCMETQKNVQKQIRRYESEFTDCGEIDPMTVNEVMDSNHQIKENEFRLKKFESDFLNVIDIFKHFIIVLFRIFSKEEKQEAINIKIKNIYRMLQNTLYFKNDLLSDNIVFLRKLFINVFKIGFNITE